MERSPRPSSPSLKRTASKNQSPLNIQTQNSSNQSSQNQRDEINSISNRSLSHLLPQLDFKNPFSNPGHYSSASTFLPLHMEKAYAYPLLVWLGGSETESGKLSKVMPKISLRNYIGIAPEIASQGDSLAQSADWCDMVFECLDKASIQYNINMSRVFLAGTGVGGQMALSMAMKHSDYFAGVISLGGQIPQYPSLMGDLRSVRQTPVFLAHSREDDVYDEGDFCDDLKVFHVGGFSVTARQYPGSNPLNDQMLHDIDVWMMEIINGYDMTASDPARHEIN